MAKVNERIAEMRNLRGMTLEELAQKVGVKNATISRYERGDIKTLKADMIVALSKALGCSPVYLMGWTDDMHFSLDGPSDRLSRADCERLRKFHALPERDQHMIDRMLEYAYRDTVERNRDQPYRPINLYSLPVSAGRGIELLAEEEPEPIYIPLTPVSRGADFVLRVQGDSMEPKYQDGDLILLRQTPDIEEGQLGVFGLNGEGYFKKLGNCTLVSLNADYPPIGISEDDELTVFGRVLGRTRQIYPHE